jgi:hypothetical protein
VTSFGFSRIFRRADRDFSSPQQVQNGIAERFFKSLKKKRIRAHRLETPPAEE